MLEGNHSAILGGSCNCDNGFNCVGIFGCAIAASVDCAFHSHNYIVSNMCPFDPIINGALFFTAASGRAVFIH